MQDERFVNEKGRHRDPHVDTRRVPLARLVDLSLRRFEEDYLPSAVDAETLASNDRSTEERLAAAKMIVSVDDPVPTVGGILVLCKRPQGFLPGAYAQFLRIAGKAFGDSVTDAEVCWGGIMHVVRRLDDKLIAHNRTSVDFLSGPVEIRDSTYPLDTVQQLVRNAVMHRTYEDTNAPIHVYWFDDHIEISSPGYPSGAVNASNFGEPGVVDYRNPILAEAMRVLGLVQRYRFGIPAARRLLRTAGHPDPEFRVDPSWVHCTVRASA